MPRRRSSLVTLCQLRPALTVLCSSNLSLGGQLFCYPPVPNPSIREYSSCSSSILLPCTYIGCAAADGPLWSFARKIIADFFTGYNRLARSPSRSEDMKLADCQSAALPPGSEVHSISSNFQVLAPLVGFASLCQEPRISYVKSKQPRLVILFSCKSS